MNVPDAAPQGLTITAVAECRQRNRRTIQRWVAAGLLDHDPRTVCYGPRSSGPTRLDPCKPLIQEPLTTYPELLSDQLKAVILDDQRPQGGRVLENPEFLRFAAGARRIAMQR